MTKLAAAVVLVLIPAAIAHPYEVHGNITLSTFGESDTILPLLESLAPDQWEGVTHVTVPGVQGGDAFRIEQDDGQSGFGCSWPDHYEPAEYDSGTPAEDTPADPFADRVAWMAEDPTVRWFGFLFCPGPAIDFDVHFTGGPHANGEGAESGTVPGDGDAIVVVFFADLGEGFTYSEA